MKVSSPDFKIYHFKTTGNHYKAMKVVLFPNVLPNTYFAREEKAQNNLVSRVCKFVHWHRF